GGAAATGAPSGEAASPSAAPAPSAASSPICTAPAELVRFERPLVHTMQRLANALPLTIVAIGSSSTAGAGASSPDATYPSRLAVELRMRFPGRDITLFNRGASENQRM